MPTLEDVRAVLSSPSFRQLARGFDRSRLIATANSIGPRMLLLPSEAVERARGIPHFSENVAKDAISEIDARGAPSVEIFMFSHRWLRSSGDPALAHPDEANNTKARALAQFTQWRKKWVRERYGFDPHIYYWIDYSSFDHANLSSNLAMLPLWVACCERFVRFETADYVDRAWCRLEMLFSYVFGFADHHVVIDRTFRMGSSQNHGNASLDIIHDPSEGRTTDPDDAARVAELAKFAAAFTPSATTQTKEPLPSVTFSQTTVKSFRL